MVVPYSIVDDIKDDDVGALSRWLDGAPPDGSVNDYDNNVDCEYPYSLLMICAEGDATKCARYLIAQGADVNERNPHPDTIKGVSDAPSLITALLVAVDHSGLEMVELLIEAGADVDARMYNGHTPLRKALLSKASRQPGGVAATSPRRRRDHSRASRFWRDAAPVDAARFY